MDKTYQGKLQGIIIADYWQKVPGRQTTLLEAIKRHQTANKSYLSTGIQILELSNRAYKLFKVRKSDEKRALLNQVLSNCKLERKNLAITYKKPFDLLAKGFSSPNWLRGPEGLLRWYFFIGLASK